MFFAIYIINSFLTFAKVVNIILLLTSIKCLHFTLLTGSHLIGVASWLPGIESESSMNNYYKILGVPVSATKEQIKRAYREKAKQYHPDVSQVRGSNIRFQLLGEAYQTLIHKDKREKYDIKLKYGIETKIKDRDREHYKRYGTSSKRPGTSFHYTFFKSKRKQKQDKKSIIFDNALFGIMMLVGGLSFFIQFQNFLQVVGVR